MKYPDSASFLQGVAKRARKYYLGVTTLTQDIEDFLSNDYGKAIVSNSSVQILLKQGSAEVEALAKNFNLSQGEKQFLLTAQVGEGLLFAGQNHITAQFIASQFEYDLITSKPQDIMETAASHPQAPSPTPPPASTPKASDGMATTILDTPNSAAQIQQPPQNQSTQQTNPFNAGQTTQPSTPPPQPQPQENPAQVTPPPSSSATQGMRNTIMANMPQAPAPSFSQPASPTPTTAGPTTNPPPVNKNG
jgi:hypothetical protein